MTFRQHLFLEFNRRLKHTKTQLTSLYLSDGRKSSVQKSYSNLKYLPTVINRTGQSIKKRKKNHFLQHAFIDPSITFKFSFKIAKNEAPLNSCPLTSFRKRVEVLAIIMFFLSFFLFLDRSQTSSKETTEQTELTTHTTFTNGFKNIPRALKYFPLYDEKDLFQ